MSERRFWSIAVVSLTLLCAVITWFISNYYMERRIEAGGSRLALLGDLRRSALENYFSTAEAELRFWSSDPVLVDSQALLVKTLHEKREELGPDNVGKVMQQRYITENPFPEQRSRLADPGDGTLYAEWHARFHPLTRLFVEERGYYDFFMISPDGFIVYTVEKESDFGTSLVTGPWRDSALADVFRRTMASVAEGGAGVEVSDIERYTPSNDVPAQFMAHPITGANGENIGVIAVQLPIEGIKDIMQFTSGMGKTGETYLVGEDLVMRSDSRFTDVPTTLENTVDTQTVHRALAGETGIDFTPDYRGIEVLSAFTRFDIGGNTWAVMAEKDVGELEQDAAGERRFLSGLMLFFYGLSLWSVWFIRRGEPGEGSASHVVDDLFDRDMPEG
ncbi:MAG: cache domain-containing protein [Halioglobus sp.]